MHFMKRRLLAGNNSSESSSNPPSNSLAGIDVNRSLTDQITKLARTEKLALHGEDTGSSINQTKSLSPQSESSDTVVPSKDLRSDSVPIKDNVLSNYGNSTQTPNDRSSSRTSEHSSYSGYGDDRRPSSRLDDLRTSSKNSPASSPLIIDRTEPVLPYRDPELMRKNPVQSNVQSMLGPPHKSSTYPGVHNPIPSAPPSGSLPTTTSFPTHPLPRTHVLPSMSYHPMGAAAAAQLGLSPGLGQLDHATLAAIQQQQLALQYSNSLLLQRSAGYPPPANLTMAQLELLWQQKYPSVPVPPQWMLASKQEDLLRDIFSMKEREIERYERDRIERERLERERMDRLEREKIERDRQIERERQERERIERERIEREKMERERAERERAERERMEKELLERERERELERKRREHEHEQRQERERILKESADTLAAVDDHFQQSLRLAKQRAQQSGMIWAPPSITLGTGKSGPPKSEQQSPSSYHYSHSEKLDKQDIIKSMEEKVKQEREREEMRHLSFNTEMLRRHEIMRQQELFVAKQEEFIKERQKALATEHKSEQKVEKVSSSRSSDNKAHNYQQAQGFKGYPVSSSSSSGSGSGVKQEPNFSLYGYQPFQHTYISPEQLHLHGLAAAEKQSEEKMNIDSKSGSTCSTSPKRPKTGVPPPLIKDIKSHSSVIVENKGKDSGKSASPRPAHSHYSSTIPMPPSTSPRPQPKPAHTPDRHHHDRPRSALASSSPSAGSYHHDVSGSMDLSSSGSHVSSLSSLKGENKHIASNSPLSQGMNHQQLASAMLGQPVDYHRGKPPASSTSSNGSSASSSNSHYMSAAIAQPPVSLPGRSLAYSYSLIQQGLVPNPIYSQSTVKSMSSAHSDQQKGNTSASIPTATSQSSSSAGQQGVKRKVIKDGPQRKRQKAENVANSALNVPVTTPQILTNHSPYTTTSSTTCTTVSSALSNVTMTTKSAMNTISSPSSSFSSSTLSTSSFMSSPSSLAPGSQTASGFMDSFKSFVENAVQNAFLQDQDLNKSSKSNNSSSSNSSKQQHSTSTTETKPQQQQQSWHPIGKSPPPPPAQVGHTPPPQPVVHHSPQSQSQPQSQPQSQTKSQNQRRKSDPLQLSACLDDSNSQTLSSSSSSISSHTALMETINRVANGQIDTDSDTLSAPSPPPHVKSDSTSPHKSGNAPKLKKAWLQRHSDEDKELKNSPVPHGDSREQKAEIVRNCYVNCSYISPSKEGGSRSPISALRINGNLKDHSISNDESTTSASETESAQNPEVPGKKRQKKRNNVNKKQRQEQQSEAVVDSIPNPTPNTNPTPVGKKKGKKNKEKDNSKNKESSEDERSNGTVVKKLKLDPKTEAKLENKLESKSEAEVNNGSRSNTTSPPVPNPAITQPTKKEKKEAKHASFLSQESSSQQAPVSEPDRSKPMDISKPMEAPLSSSLSSSGSLSNVSSKEKKKHKKEKQREKEREKERERERGRDRENEKDRERDKERDRSRDRDREKEKDREKDPDQEALDIEMREREREWEREKARGCNSIIPPKEVEFIAKNNGSSFNKPLVKATVATLKRTCQPFLQDGSCSEVTPKLMKCRECKMTPTQRSKKLPNIFCRFYAFRRLRYSQKGFLTIAGFSELSDAEYDDIEPWLPHTPVMEPKMDIETSKYVVSKIGDRFCELVEQEREARSWAGEEAKIAWKRAVTGVREMCDVCDTTLFNMHWVCHKCGFVVCLDCYKVRMRALKREEDDEEKDEREDEEEDDIPPGEDQRRWLTCSSNRQQHEVDKLMLTQIIPRDALWEVGRLIHEIRNKWDIPSKCSCDKSMKYPPKNGITQKYLNALNHISNEKNRKMVNGVGDDHKSHKGNRKHDSQAVNGNVKSSLGGYSPDSSSPLRMLADVASMDSENSRERSESPYNKRRGETDKYGKGYNPITEPVSPCGQGNVGESESDKKGPTSCSTLRELLTKTAGKVKSGGESNKKPAKSKNNNSSTLDDIIQSVVEKQLPRDENSQPIKLMHYIPRSGYSGMIACDTPILVHNLTETSVLYPDVPHSWLCDGRLLRLHDPKHKGNFKIFQEQMKRGQPVLVSGVDNCLNRNLWSPKTFSREFGKHKNDLINTRNGCLIVGHPMATFWEGFDKISERLVDDEGDPILLKLKDWPPGDDFSDLMPQHFEDLMQALPLPEYTHRQGRLNLASRLPDFLVRPDLGPKMYNAYGSALHPEEGTTNLHLDVSDAVNVMVYVGIPEDDAGGRAFYENAALQAIDEAGCDMITKRRVREVHEVPGALWQIWDARDADKMRDFLNKVAKERGEVIEQHHDPIHDQSWYLNEQLRDRLYKEYGVLGYTIVQCAGDAIFIPAGAPHQVRNLHSCIKVAEDFVSPEHLNHCFSLTQEFRLLSDTHSNHEDKLQVKNIVYHAVKDAIAVLNEADRDDE
ncbi:probable JmjC domain-containing histone demethylation protein 2C isoform X2 [Ylistrum balloti]|uniref:probable JmjC domain-containing histone demethylation protein 2C isoform X2 n=1 Tax=Ylistrum balloti TaxID=509963 RepID=UPI002905A095|nr:probable JmjC domain-containing histone demethylation protein 2C isoform X2 [Ylistrum balloti]